MAVGFRVRYHSSAANLQGERLLYQLPIRFGRNALNHCQIVHGYISDFHAIIESTDGQLCIRDLNSKNGVYFPSGQRIATNVPVPLSGMNFTFVLGRLAQVQVEVFEQNRAVGERMSETRGNVIGNRAVLESAPAPNQWQGQAGWRGSSPPYPSPANPYDVAPLPPLSADASGLAARNAPVPPAPNPGWSPQGAVGMSQGLPALAPPQPPPQPYAPRQTPYPSPAHAPAAAVDRSTGYFTMSIETMALLGLRELAGSLVPGASLQTTGDVARLLTKLHDTVEVFCRCFVPLREGHAQFVSQMDLRQAASQRSLNRSVSAARVEAARDPAGVAVALLDWRNQDYDAPEVVEGIFADLMMHQLALVESVMRGVQALLHELSPERIEQLFEEEKPAGVSAMLGRHRALWQTFKAHHEALANETRTFELVFGPDFAAAYREYLVRQKRSA